MDLLQNTGVKEAVAGKTIIFHLATDMKKDARATQHLLNAIGKNPQMHLIYISIVGIDKTPFPYYRQKLASEQAIIQSQIPFTILRATQFHEFIDMLCNNLLKYRIGVLPKRLVAQPIDKEAVAQKLFQLSLQPPLNGIVEIGGPEVFTMQQMADEWMKTTGKKRWILNLPLLGKLARAFNGGALTTRHIHPNTLQWHQWLQAKYGTEPHNK